jgi:hypothetical protein
MKKNLIILSMLVLGVFMFSMVSAGLFDFTGNAIAKFDDSADIELKEGTLTKIELDGEDVELLAVVIDGDSATINVDGNIIEMSKRKSKRVGKYTIKLVSTESSFWRRDTSKIEIVSKRNLQELIEDEDDSIFYPIPFVVEGIVDAAIIYGTEPDISILELVETGNIQSDLFEYIEIIEGGPEEIMISSDELPSFAEKNLIIVGSHCSNSVIWDLLGEDSCEDVWENEINIGPGEFLIESFVNPFNEEKIMLYVVGYDIIDVVLASQYVRNNLVDTSIGARYVGSVEEENFENCNDGCTLNEDNSWGIYEGYDGDYNIDLESVTSFPYSAIISVSDPQSGSETKDVGTGSPKRIGNLLIGVNSIDDFGNVELEVVYEYAGVGESGVTYEEIAVMLRYAVSDGARANHEGTCNDKCAAVGEACLFAQQMESSSSAPAMLEPCSDDVSLDNMVDGYMCYCAGV